MGIDKFSTRWLNKVMRISNHSVEAPNNGRVNINNLMSKIRADHKKKRKENLVFVGLIGSIVVITGIIASL